MSVLIGYDVKTSGGEAPALELRVMGGTFWLPLIQSLLWVVKPNSVLSIGQIQLFNI